MKLLSFLAITAIVTTLLQLFSEFSFLVSLGIGAVVGVVVTFLFSSGVAEDVIDVGLDAFD